MAAGAVGLALEQHLAALGRRGQLRQIGVRLGPQRPDVGQQVVDVGRLGHDQVAAGHAGPHALARIGPRGPAVVRRGVHHADQADHVLAVADAVAHEVPGQPVDPRRRRSGTRRNCASAGSSAWRRGSRFRRGGRRRAAAACPTGIVASSLPSANVHHADRARKVVGRIEPAGRRARWPARAGRCRRSARGGSRRPYTAPSGRWSVRR